MGYCKKCGQQLTDNSQYCINCGCGQTDGQSTSAAPSKKSFSLKGKKKWIWTVAAIAIAVVLLLTLLPLQKTESLIGYSTPEDAVNSYIKNLGNANMNGALKALAIESYVEKYDVEAQVQRISTFMPLRSYLPDSNSLFTAYNLQKRKSELYSIICQQYLTFCYPDWEPSLPIQFGSEQEADEFVKNLKQNTSASRVKNLKIERVENATASMTEANYIQNLVAQSQVIGADELVDVAAMVSLDGQQFGMGFQVARYGNIWRIATLGSPILSVPAATGMVTLP